MIVLRVFVSSTYLDLLDHRQAVSEAIRGLDLHVDGMETWAADARDSTSYSTDRVTQADVYVLLLAHRYGWVPQGAQYSITELEYRAAREAKVPVLAFFLGEDVPWPPQHIEWEARDALLRFKKDIEGAVTRKYFRTPQELALRVTQALAQQAARPAERTTHRFAGPVRPLSTPSRLISEPDVLYSVEQLQEMKLQHEASATTTALSLEESPNPNISNLEQHRSTLARSLIDALDGARKSVKDEDPETFENATRNIAREVSYNVYAFEQIPGYEAYAQALRRQVDQYLDAHEIVMQILSIGAQKNDEQAWADVKQALYYIIDSWIRDIWDWTTTPHPLQWRPKGKLLPTEAATTTDAKF